MQNGYVQLVRDTEIASMFNCSRSTVWKMAENGDIPKPIKFGNMTRWHLPDIEAAVASKLAQSETPTTRKRIRATT